MSVRTVQLGEVCEFIRGVTFDKSEATTTPEIRKIPILRAGNIGEELDAQNDLVWVPETLVNPEQHLRRNDIAICMSSGSPEVVGKTARAPSNLHASVGSFCGIIRPKKADQAAYLSFYFRSSAFWKYRDAIARGANIQNLRFSQFEEIQLKIPEEQNRIAGVLEQADRLRRTRRYALELNDTFLPAAFLELFGDPRKTTDRWDAEPLENLGTLDRGRSKHRPRNAPHLYGGPYPFIQTGDVANAKGYIRNHAQTYSEAGLKQSKLWASETLCITIAANIGRTAILTYPACFPDSVVGFVPGERVRIEFIQFWFQFLQETLENTAPEVAQKNINLEILRELRCPVPPLRLQQKFAALVEQHERLRASEREALRQADHLFQSLLHRAFTTGL